VEVCELMVDLLVEFNSDFVKVGDHCHHCAMNAVFSNYNVTSVLRAAIIGLSVDPSQSEFAVLDIRLCCPYIWL